VNILKLADDVYEVKNFLTDQENEEVYKIINSVTEEDWFDKELNHENNTLNFWYGKNLLFKDITIFDTINKKMRLLLQSYSHYPSNIQLSRYKKGDFIKPHKDQLNPDLPYYIGYGFCLYYNDDYDGGELEYPELNLTIKPKAGSLYIHGGNVLHKSLPVLGDNIRYFSTVFVHGTTELPTKLRADIFT
jgi:Rps23 Pro-64 3,4-dihydroxylase Tpa1-like proline 4-hydroxylase